ncbi:hypothetical protein TNIN_216871 [Trichonephila inaurata madagascariensis]|uniref:Uncharacterized protein n=1 Tax=Trichonephila inaurata madagascariensis TaxID=2747483 RepID=A0A8X6YF71_9ARAC|nr:hypothetical protein TNIN_216871 [Trichonephila inaurata madagascariensis]
MGSSSVYNSCYILSDSRAAVLDIISDSNPITKGLDCRHDLKNLTSRGKTRGLKFVPAHCRVIGNEKANFLA